MQCQRTVMENGLTVLRIPMPAVSSVTTLVLANTGSRYETQPQQGVAHFLEHMVFKGTAQYPTAQVLAAAVDAVGARFNAFTSKEYTGYYVKSAAEHLPLALDVVSDMLLTPQLRQADIDREKGVIIEEMNMYNDMPAHQVSRLFDQMMFVDGSLGHDIVGTKETVLACTTKTFQTFLQQWYHPSNLLLILAGDEQSLMHEGCLEQISQAFSKPVVGRKPVAVAAHFGSPPVTDTLLHVEYKKTEQAHFILGWPGYNRHHTLRHAAALLATILGGNMSSRLFTEVREKRGLCYSIHAETDFFHDAGFFGAAAGVDPKRIDEAVAVTLEQFMQLTTPKHAITAQELATAKDHVAGKFILDLEESESVAQYYGMKQLFQGEIETPDEVLAKYRAVTLADIAHVVQDMLSQKPRFALVGPYKSSQRFQTLLSQV